MSLNILYQIKERWDPAPDLGKERFLRTLFFSTLYFTLMHPMLLKKKMKLAHQGLNYVLFDGHRYCWQPSQGYSLDKSSYCLRHEVSDCESQSDAAIHDCSITAGKRDFCFIMTLNFGETSESFCSASGVHLQYLRTELFYRLKHVKTQRSIK